MQQPQSFLDLDPLVLHSRSLPGGGQGIRFICVINPYEVMDTIRDTQPAETDI